MLKIKAHCAFTSKSGYASHARNFFTALNRFSEVRVEDLFFADYELSEEQNSIVNFKKGNFYPWKFGTEFNYEDWKDDQIVDIVLSTTGSSDFSKIFPKHKIAYNVWESTRQPDDFFELLKKYDQLWVPSEWQRQCSIDQGFDPERVIVIPEGIDLDFFTPSDTPVKNEKFRFGVFGKWEYRKSTKEIVESFLSEFKDDNNVELILCADNNWPVDGYKTTEERLKAYGLEDERIKVIHYLNSDYEYRDLLRSLNCFVSCSRSEGWNIPLMEAIACGVPTIATDWGAPLDFCEGISALVDVKEFRKPQNVYGYKEGTCPGEWAEPDFDNLKYTMRNVYNIYDVYWKEEAYFGRDKLKRFTWDKIAKKANDTLNELISKPYLINKTEFEITYNDGVTVHTKGNTDKTSNLKFYDNSNNNLIYETNAKINTWSMPNAKYFVDWRVEIKNEETEIIQFLNYKNKEVLINIESSALGDTIAWFPYLEEFRKKHNCKLIARTFHNKLFEKNYPEIKFISPDSSIPQPYATYKLGVYSDSDNRNKTNWKTIPLQRVASDILGLEYEEIIPKIVFDKEKVRPIEEKYVAISPNGSARAKLWNLEGGWQKIINYLNEIGYKVMIISKEENNFENVINAMGKPIEETINNIKHAEFYIGCGSGPSWLAYGLNKKVVLISGFSEKWTEFTKNCYRIINTSVCHGCYNDKNIEFDRGDWEWCMSDKKKEKFECTKQISVDMVKDKINKVIKDLK